VGFTFIHAADLHLDTPFEGIARVSPEVAAQLRDASLDAFDALVACAIRKDAAFVLLAGDIYDGPARGVRAQLRFLRGLERLSARGIKTCIVHGNHDPLEGWSAIKAWPQGVTVFGSEKVESVVVERGGVRVATVQGISYAQRAAGENLAPRFKRTAAPGLHVGLLHCTVGQNAEHETCCPTTVRDLQGTGMNYWALGHIHRREYPCEGGPWIVYPGNLQGRSPKPSECGAKGAVVVEVDGSLVTRVEFEALDRVRFVAPGFDVSGIQELPALRPVLLQRLEQLRKEHEGRGLLVRAALRGRGGVHRDLARPGALEALLEDLRTECRDLAPFVWWESLQDATRPRIDVEEVRKRGDFLSELVRVAESLGADAEERARFTAEAVAALPLARLNDKIPEPGADTLTDELDRAMLLALELLEEEADA
jgi:DNA repair protein SbcD/Mre11